MNRKVKQHKSHKLPRKDLPSNEDRINTTEPNVARSSFSSRLDDAEKVSDVITVNLLFSTHVFL